MEATPVMAEVNWRVNDQFGGLDGEVLWSINDDVPHPAEVATGGSMKAMRIRVRTPSQKGCLKNDFMNHLSLGCSKRI
jgi:hypothetical protein